MTVNRDVENEQRLLASYLRARPGDLGPVGRPRPAGPHPTPDADPGLSLSHGGYAIPDRLQYSRLSIHTSPVYTILGGLYNSRVASLQISGGYTTLDLPYHARPAMQFSTGYAIIYRRASVP